MMGEGVIGWDKADYGLYRTMRLRIDSQLQGMKPLCREYVRTEQIDTLRSMQEDKEIHLRHIMETIGQQERADSLLVNLLPDMARRATRVRTVKRKKSRLAGLFGGKKPVQELPSVK